MAGEMKIGIKLGLCFYLTLSVYAVCLAQKPELVVQTGHSTMVDTIAFH